MFRGRAMAGISVVVLSWQLAVAFPADESNKAQHDAMVHVKRGSDSLRSNQPQQAIQHLKTALGLNPQSALAHLLLGQAYLQQGSVAMVAEAKAEFLQALDLDPNLIWARFYLAKVYMDVGRLERAKQELEQGLARQANIPHFLALLAEVNRRLEHFDLSIELAEKALAVDSSMTPAHYYLALTYIDLGDEQRASGELEKALDSAHVTPEIYITLGSIHARRENYDTAEKLFRKAVALDPSRPEAHLKLGELYRLRGSPDRALKELELAAPEAGPALNSPYYQSLDADVRYEQGRAYDDKGKTDEALKAYLQALEMNPNHGKAHGQTAKLLWRQGKRESAREHASEAEALGAPVEPALREAMQSASGNNERTQP